MRFQKGNPEEASQSKTSKKRLSDDIKARALCAGFFILEKYEFKLTRRYRQKGD